MAARRSSLSLMQLPSLNVAQNQFFRKMTTSHHRARKADRPCRPLACLERHPVWAGSGDASASYRRCRRSWQQTHPLHAPSPTANAVSSASLALFFPGSPRFPWQLLTRHRTQCKPPARLLRDQLWGRRDRGPANARRGWPFVLGSPARWLRYPSCRAVKGAHGK